MKKVYVLVMLFLMACSQDMATQHYWKCWNSDSMLYSVNGYQPHKGTNNQAEHDCLDSELMSSGFVKDSNFPGGWRAK